MPLVIMTTTQGSTVQITLRAVRWCEPVLSSPIDNLHLTLERAQASAPAESFPQPLTPFHVHKVSCPYLHVVLTESTVTSNAPPPSMEHLGEGTGSY